MKNLRKKTGCLVMAVMLLIMTFVPAMSVTVSAAANIEGRLITVGGKTVNSGMKIAEVEKLFGKPKLKRHLTGADMLIRFTGISTVTICIWRQMRMV